MLQAMAARDAAGARSDLGDLGHDLALLGIKDSAGKPLSADTLAAALESGIRDAVAHPDRPTSLAPLLIRELGRSHSPSVDLASNVPAAQIQLDPVQRYLLSADILIPWAVGNAPARQARLAPRDAVTGWLFGGGAAGASPIQQAVQSAATVPPPISLADVALWFKAQAFKNFMMDIHPQIDQPLETHYGPAHDGDGGLGGKQLDFQLHAAVPALTLGNQAACVKEMSLILYGNVCTLNSLTGMAVDWDTSSITPYGTLNSGIGGVGNDRDDVRFTPKTEALPGIGVLKVAAGVVTASPHVARYLDVTDPRLAALVDAEYANQQFPWKVSYHEAAGLSFSLPALTVFSRPGDQPSCTPEQSCDGGAVTTLQPSTVHICASRTPAAFSSPEEGQTVQTYTGGSTATIPLHNGFIEWHVDSNLSLDAEGLYSHVEIEGRITGNPPTLHIRLSGPSDDTSKVYSVTPNVISVPVEIEPAC
jgi:hypothetical protein